MPHSKTEMLGIAERRAKVAALLAEGKRQFEIARLLGLNKMTVSCDIKAIEQEWRDAALLDFDEARGIQIARLEHLYAKTTRQWEKSMLDPKTVSKTKYRKKRKDEIDKDGSVIREGGMEDNGETLSVTVDKQHGEGDKGYISLLLSITDRICQLRGLFVKPGEMPTNPPVLRFEIHTPEQREEAEVIEHVPGPSMPPVSKIVNDSLVTKAPAQPDDEDDLAAQFAHL
jgi:hypothetical protein